MVSPGFYRHHKGNEYEVTGTVHDASQAASLLPIAMQRIVLYRGTDNECHARPAVEFVEHVYDGSNLVPRFRKLEDGELLADAQATILAPSLPIALPGMEGYV